MKKFVLLVLLALLVSATPVAMVGAQDSLIESLCLVTDLGKINDGTFNQFAHEGATMAVEEYDLDYTYIETQAQTDYEKNIQTCVDEGYDAIITVGFLIADVTGKMAAANPDVYFIGVDQFVAEGPTNYVGLQFREDQAGFVAGVIAAQMSSSGTIAGVYGIDIPPVKKFRNGFENGAKFVNPDIKLLGVYNDSFIAPDKGAAAAAQFIGEGADVVFGAGGPTGSGGIVKAAELGAFVVGVDQDEYVTTFGAGSSPGADKIITSAMKRVDQAVLVAVGTLVAGGADFPGGNILVMSAENDGVGFAPAHDAAVPTEVTAKAEEVLAGLKDGSITTGVDPVSGDLAAAEAPAAAAESLIESVCLVTDLGKINDGTFNQFAHEGATMGTEEFDLDYTYIETQAQTDYEKNIQTCVDEGYDAIVTVGFLIADVTAKMAAANPDVYFIGVDQFVMDGPTNYVGLQFREDQGGFLAGALAAQMSKSGVIAGVYGIDIPPVKKFRNGFETGAKFINPDIKLLGVYHDSFIAPDKGAATAAQFIGEGADVIMGAGGPTGSGGIVKAAELGALVIGVDQDEYVTTFGGGTSPNADKIISSAMKRVDQAVRLAIATLAQGGADFPGGSILIMSAENDGIGFAPAHDASVPQEVTDKMNEILAGLKDGSIQTGVDPVSGDLLPA